MIHIPVLLREVMGALALKAGSNVIDATLGEGGHALTILERIGPTGMLLGFDRDSQQLERAKQILKDFEKQVLLVNEAFSNVKKLIEEHPDYKQYSWSGILFDLGWSQAQMEKGGRGFTFLKDEPLDMRYDPKEKVSAAIIVNTYKQEAIADILRRYGEERFADRIASQLHSERKQKPITSTFQLIEIIKKTTPFWYHHRKIHYATKVFQALRIAVNNEYGQIEEGLEGGLQMICPGGRVVVISFHSGEDRIVKNTFREFQKNKRGSILTKKPIIPSLEEKRSNPRARSAKLRVFQKAS